MKAPANKTTKKSPVKSGATKTATVAKAPTKAKVAAAAKAPAKAKVAAAAKAPAKAKTSATTKPVAKRAPAKSASKERSVTFAYRAEAGSKIFLSGTFNNWNPTAKQLTYKKKDGIYSGVISLAPGSYEYKFVIDGTWCADPECADWVQNDHGTLNSVKHISV